MDWLDSNIQFFLRDLYEIPLVEKDSTNYQIIDYQIIDYQIINSLARCRESFYYCQKNHIGRRYYLDCKEILWKIEIEYSKLAKEIGLTDPYFNTRLVL